MEEIKEKKKDFYDKLLDEVSEFLKGLSEEETAVVALFLLSDFLASMKEKEEGG